MKLLNFLLILLFLSYISKSYAENHEEILSYLNKSDEYSYFFKLIKKANYEKLFIKEAKFKKVLYIPDNDAFDRLLVRLQEVFHKYLLDYRMFYILVILMQREIGGMQRIMLKQCG